MSVVAAVLAALAGALLVSSRRVTSRSTYTPVARKSLFGDPRAVRIVAAVSGAIFAFVWGGIVGVVLGCAIAVAVPIAIGRLESGVVRARREALQAQSAVCADLLASCLISGAPPATAARAVCAAMPPPMSEHLRALVSALDLGADPVSAWQKFGVEAPLHPIARAAARSAETGASLAPLLVGVADDLRRAERSRGEAAARAAGIKAVGPLVVCFLPAFLFLGVVPIVASLAAPLLA